MCVIIYIPNTSTITREELVKAWNRNSDGAGYCMQKDGKVYTKRGFMKMNEFIDEVQEYIGKYNIALHFRISTSKAVNPLQTHPYMIDNITKMEGETSNGVACMNGVIKSNYTKRKKWNDTMNYIVDNRDTFNRANKHILDMMETETGSKWLLMKPRNVIMSKGFKEKDGRWYSNTYHLNTYTYYGYRRKNTVNATKQTNRRITTKKTSKVKQTNICDYDIATDDENFIFDYGWKKSKKTEATKYVVKPTDYFTPHLINQLKRDTRLWGDILNFIETRCNCKVTVCNDCNSCFWEAKTKKEVEDKINVDYYNGGFVYGYNR